jgi:hypothetical protein
MNEPGTNSKGSPRRAELSAMSLADFKQMIAVTCGPREEKDRHRLQRCSTAGRPTLVRPGDRGYSKVGPPTNGSAQ